MRTTAECSQASESTQCNETIPSLTGIRPTPLDAMEGVARGRALFGMIGKAEKVKDPSPPLQAIGPGALHEIGCPRTEDWGTAAAFALYALQMACRHSPSHADGEGALLWIQQDLAEREAGRPCARGLAQAGLSPSKVILVRARTARDVLWAMEEGLRCGALAAVIGELHGDHGTFDFTASRRLSLAARGTGVTAFLLRPAGQTETFSQVGSAAGSRWLVAAAASLRESFDGRAPGPARAGLSLLKARGRMPGRWDIAIHALRDGGQCERDDGPADIRTAHSVPEADMLAGGPVAHGTGLARPRRRTA